MSCLKAYEDGRAKAVLSYCKAYSKLRDWINVDNLYKDKALIIDRLRTHAVDLAREQIQDEIQSVNGTSYDSPEDKKKSKRQHFTEAQTFVPGRVHHYQCYV